MSFFKKRRKKEKQNKQNSLRYLFKFRHQIVNLISFELGLRLCGLDL